MLSEKLNFLEIPFEEVQNYVLGLIGFVFRSIVPSSCSIGSKGTSYIDIDLGCHERTNPISIYI